VKIANPPWAEYGTEVTGKTSVLKETGLNWKVEYLPQRVSVGGRSVVTGRYAYVGPNNSILSSDAVEDEPPFQNQEALTLFNQYLTESGSEIVAAGSLRSDRLVWFLAATKYKFSLNRNGSDPVVGHVLFTNYHEPNRIPDIRFMPIRMVPFTPLSVEMISEYSDPSIMPGLIDNTVKREMKNWKVLATRMESATYSEDQVKTFVEKVFPLSGVGRPRWETSIPAKRTLEAMNSFPGAYLGAGTWWHAYTAICYSIDYLLGHGVATRLDSSWYGINQKRKVAALELISREITATQEA
jgi:hypothetical protein